MADNAVLTVNIEELRSYAGSVRGEAPSAQALSANSTGALSANGPALGGEAAKAASDLGLAWAAADEAYVKRLQDTADQVESSAAAYDGSDESGARSLRLVEQAGGQ